MKPVNEIQPATPANGKEVPTAIMLQAKMAPRWAAIIGILALGVLYALLPAKLRIVPGWSLLAIEVVLLLPVVLLWITQRTFSHKIVRILSLVILGIVTLALASGVIEAAREDPPPFMVRDESAVPWMAAGVVGDTRLTCAHFASIIDAWVSKKEPRSNRSPSAFLWRCWCSCIRLLSNMIAPSTGKC